MVSNTVLKTAPSAPIHAQPKLENLPAVRMCLTLSLRTAQCAPTPTWNSSKLHRTMRSPSLVIEMLVHMCFLNTVLKDCSLCTHSDTDAATGCTVHCHFSKQQLWMASVSRSVSSPTNSMYVSNLRPYKQHVRFLTKLPPVHLDGLHIIPSK